MKRQTFSRIRELLLEIFEKDQVLAQNKKIIAEKEKIIAEKDELISQLREHSLDYFQTSHDVDDLKKELNEALNKVAYWKDYALTAIDLLKKEKDNLSEEGRQYIIHSVFPSGKE